MGSRLGLGLGLGLGLLCLGDGQPPLKPGDPSIHLAAVQRPVRQSGLGLGPGLGLHDLYSGLLLGLDLYFCIRVRVVGMELHCWIGWCGRHQESTWVSDIVVGVRGAARLCPHIAVQGG